MKVISIATACMMFVFILLNGCTISFQNISTHGVAEDLVDENQANTPNISPVIQVPGI